MCGPGHGLDCAADSSHQPKVTAMPSSLLAPRLTVLQGHSCTGDGKQNRRCDLAYWSLRCERWRRGSEPPHQKLRRKCESETRATQASPYCRLSTIIAVTLRAPQCARLASRGLASHRRRPLARAGDLDVPALAGCALNGMHDLEDVIGQFSGGAVCLQGAAAESSGQVGQTEPTTVLRVGARYRNIAPDNASCPTHAHGSAEGVGIGQTETSLRAVNLELGRLRCPDIEAGDQRCDGATPEVEHRRLVRRDLDRYSLPGSWPSVDRPFRKGHPRGAGHSPHRTQERDECGQVVRPHVEQRPATRLIVEIGLWVPPLMAGDEHERRRRHRLTDGTLVDELTTGL